MQLRIIDREGLGEIELRLEWDGGELIHRIAGCESPYSKNLRQTISEYFLGINNDSAVDNPTLNIAEKLLAGGARLGDALLGEDHELLKMIQVIEKTGYSSLKVSIEAKQPDFYNELWETLVLPETPYVLSAAVRGFVRSLPQGPADPSIERQIGLHADNRLNDQIQAMLGATDPSETANEARPLRVLWYVARQSDATAASVALSYASLAAKQGGNIVYEIMYNPSLDHLADRLANSREPIHILHFDGEIQLTTNGATFYRNDVQEEIARLFNLVIRADIPCVTLSVCQYTRGRDSVDHTNGIASVVAELSDCPLPNLLALTHNMPPQISADCFHQVYTQLLYGHELGQAVVEARKLFQASGTVDLYSHDPVAYPRWSALLHFGGQPVTFFSTPLATSITDLPDAPSLKVLYGFPTTASRKPLLTSDGGLLTLVNRLQSFARGNVEWISGHPGIGKTEMATRLSRYLAAASKIDLGFYFSFKDYNYSIDDVVNMTAGVLGLDTRNRQQYVERIAHLHCCFVMDDVEDEQQVLPLIEFLQPLNQQLIVCSRVASSISFSLAGAQLLLSRMTQDDQKIVFAHMLRESEVPYECTPDIVRRLCAKTGGNPWLMQKIIPLLAVQPVEKTYDELERLVDSDVKSQFYRSRWLQLSSRVQQLLMLCQSTPALVLEMLSLAQAEMRSNNDFVRSFFTDDDTSNLQLTQVIDHCESLGFLRRLPIGRVLDDAALEFLRQFDEPEVHALAFSRWLSVALSALAGKLTAQQNAELFHYVILQRQQWVKHFERLWFNRDYTHFFSAKSGMERLMLQVGLLPELAAWSLDLLQRSTQEDAALPEGEHAIAWLMLGTDIGRLDVAVRAEWLSPYIDAWFAQYTRMAASAPVTDLPLFQQLCSFLLASFEHAQAWSRCLEVAQPALAVYVSHSAWQRAVKLLKSLARYARQSGQHEQARSFENQLLRDIPFDDAAPGYQLQQWLDIALLRVAHGDTENAQHVLDEIRALDTVGQFAVFVDGIQCDIDYQRGDYEAALPGMIKLWSQAKQGGDASHLEPLQEKLDVIRNAIGSERFYAIVRHATPTEDPAAPARLLH